MKRLLLKFYSVSLLMLFSLLIISSCKKSSDEENVNPDKEPTVAFNNEARQGESLVVSVKGYSLANVSASIAGINCYAVKQNDTTVNLIVPTDAPSGAQKIDLKLDNKSFSYPLTVLVTQLDKPASTIISDQINSVISQVEIASDNADSLAFVQGYDFNNTKAALSSLTDSLTKYKGILLKANSADQAKAAIFLKANAAYYAEVKESLRQISLQTKEIIKLNEQINKLRTRSVESVGIESMLNACQERILFNQMKCLVTQHMESIKKLGKWAVVLYASTALPFPFNVAVAGVSVAYIIEAGIEAYQNHVALQNVAFITVDAAAGTTEQVFMNDTDGSIYFKGNYANASAEEAGSNAIAATLVSGYNSLTSVFQKFASFTSFKIPSLSPRKIKAKAVETFENLKVKVISGSDAITASLSGTVTNLKLKLNNVPKDFDDYVTVELNYNDQLQKPLITTLKVKAKNFDSTAFYKNAIAGKWVTNWYTTSDGKFAQKDEIILYADGTGKRTSTTYADGKYVDHTGLWGTDPFYEIVWTANWKAGEGCTMSYWDQRWGVVHVGKFYYPSLKYDNSQAQGYYSVYNSKQ
ncbi:hypothetical protein [Solitalea canadensis]|uniref:Uncharacterized protein n=1 Tax=Solitalea canadensis (strain ATCC 29591 / DSM 3403 / JCM 21819 / LMG 8368 / NBRC 15130 / NCIMB 12057 / USAM 9D) TaxID=929556 RepID=H8KTW9_SOLCM|nr:hypothetical protein [Solitalea canadensis]AFD06819.1 hypothetical protein Solca_1753 [Solitalea canadensis DSM 3403]